MAMIFIDTHVHIHDCFSLDRFFDSAWANFQFAQKSVSKKCRFKSVLMLTESNSVNRFDQLIQAVGNKREMIRNWMIRATTEDSSFCLRRNSNQNIYVIAGRQIQASEGLEVLALGIGKKFKDGISIKDLIEKIETAGGVPVVPWGFGKWIGRRGNILNQLLKDSFSEYLCLGDNGGRSNLLNEPSQFKVARKKNIKILPGSDPLPFSNQYQRAGSYGFYFEGEISDSYPARDIKQKLRDPSFDYHCYGSLETFPNFIRNQIMMQFKTRFGKKLGKLL